MDEGTGVTEKLEQAFRTSSPGVHILPECERSLKSLKKTRSRNLGNGFQRRRRLPKIVIAIAANTMIRRLIYAPGATPGFPLGHIFLRRFDIQLRDGVYLYVARR